MKKLRLIKTPFHIDKEEKFALAFKCPKSVNCNYPGFKPDDLQYWVDQGYRFLIASNDNGLEDVKQAFSQNYVEIGFYVTKNVDNQTNVVYPKANGMPYGEYTEARILEQECIIERLIEMRRVAQERHDILLQTNNLASETDDLLDDIEFYRNCVVRHVEHLKYLYEMWDSLEFAGCYYRLNVFLNKIAYVD